MENECNDNEEEHTITNEHVEDLRASDILTNNRNSVSSEEHCKIWLLNESNKRTFDTNEHYKRVITTYKKKDKLSVDDEKISDVTMLTCDKLIEFEKRFTRKRVERVINVLHALYPNVHNKFLEGKHSITVSVKISEDKGLYKSEKISYYEYEVIKDEIHDGDHIDFDMNGTCFLDSVDNTGTEIKDKCNYTYGDCDIRLMLTALENCVVGQSAINKETHDAYLIDLRASIEGAKIINKLNIRTVVIKFFTLQTILINELGTQTTSQTFGPRLLRIILQQQLNILQNSITSNDAKRLRSGKLRSRKCIIMPATGMKFCNNNFEANETKDRILSCGIATLTETTKPPINDEILAEIINGMTLTEDVSVTLKEDGTNGEISDDDNSFLNSTECFVANEKTLIDNEEIKEKQDEEKRG